MVIANFIIIKPYTFFEVQFTLGVPDWVWVGKWGRENVCEN